MWRFQWAAQQVHDWANLKLINFIQKLKMSYVYFFFKIDNISHIYLALK